MLTVRRICSYLVDMFTTRFDIEDSELAEDARRGIQVTAHRAPSGVTYASTPLCRECDPRNLAYEAGCFARAACYVCLKPTTRMWVQAVGS